MLCTYVHNNICTYIIMYKCTHMSHFLQYLIYFEKVCHCFNKLTCYPERISFKKVYNHKYLQKTFFFFYISWNGSP